MARTGHISKRAGTSNYQARMRVPDDLISVLGTHMNESLGTPDYNAAKKRSREVVAKWEAMFQDLRARREMTDADLEAAAAEHWRQALDGDLEERNRLPVAADKDAAHQALAERVQRGEVPNETTAILLASLDHHALIDHARYDRERRTRLLAILEKQVATGETTLISPSVDAYIDRHKLTVEKGSKAYRDLAHRIARAEIDALKRTLERDRGDFTGTPNDPLLSDVTIATRDSTTFDTIIDRQIERNANGIGGRKKSAATERKYRVILKGFATWRGSARAATVTVHEVEQWRDALFKTDKQKTVRDKVATVRTILKWGHTQSKGKLFPKGFPLDHLELPANPENDTTGKAYTVQQAQKVLRAARKQEKPFLRWIPWLIAYSAARINEIAPLERQDVFKIGKDWFIHIHPQDSEEHATKQGRTTKSNKGRKVPIHPDIIADGFIDFVEKIESGRLFPDARIDQNMRDWIRDTVMKREKTAPAPNHGFRHLWEDLRRMKLDHGAALYIAGRASRTSDDLYGKSNAMLPALAEEMKKFPSIINAPKAEAETEKV